MHKPNKPEGERGEFYSVTGHEDRGWYSLWDRYPDSLLRSSDRFALYDPKGIYINCFSSATDGERYASFLMLD